MILKNIAAAGFLMLGMAVGSGAYAGDDADQGDDSDIPNVLIVKVPEDAAQGKVAQVIALKLEKLPYSGEMINLTEFDTQCDAQLLSAEAIDINAAEYSDDGVPETVREVFEQAEHDTEVEQLNWRFYAGNRGVGFGIYGYGHNRGYGYGHYPRYSSRWGVHRGNNHYRYYPSYHHRRYGGYNNYYYYRW